jgi:PilZ domain
MIVEHRWSKRKPIALDVLVHYRSFGVVRGKARDIGVGGMFVETGAITLNLNALVEVNVRTQKDVTDRPYRLRALVVRTAPHGAGLMFRSFDQASYGVLRELLFEDQGITAEGRVVLAD